MEEKGTDQLENVKQKFNQIIDNANDEMEEFNTLDRESKEYEVRYDIYVNNLFDKLYELLNE